MARRWLTRRWLDGGAGCATAHQENEHSFNERDDNTTDHAQGFAGRYSITAVFVVVVVVLMNFVVIVVDVVFVIFVVVVVDVVFVIFVVVYCCCFCYCCC